MGVLANDTIIINNQAFEQITFGLPMNIKNGNNTITDTITGQIGLMPYQNVIISIFSTIFIHASDLGYFNVNYC